MTIFKLAGVYINPLHVIRLTKGLDGEGTLIEMTEGKNVRVYDREPDTVAALINANL